MDYKLIDGRKISTEIKDEIKKGVEELKAAGITPSLAVICAGNNAASAIYVKHKRIACEYCGIKSLVFQYPDSVSEEELLAKVNELNEDKACSGILVQLPLPDHINTENIIKAISPLKDVDGFSPVSAGALSIGQTGLVPCTPLGIIELLKRSGVEIQGKEAVVIGRSNIVGKPVAMLLLRENATVTVCHSKTENLSKLCRRADILVAAIGKQKFITEAFIKEGAAVIDVGIHRDENNRLSGDVDFENVKQHCSFITPVPGGVGPMTIAMLMKNTLTAARLQCFS